MTTTTQREWSPLPLLYKDLQQTVPLTCRFLTLIPSDRIHPLLHCLFGEAICTRGQDRPNEMYRVEARDVAAQLPPIETFTDLLPDKLTRGVTNPLIRNVAFVLALLGVPGRSSLTKEDNKELVAIKMVLNEMDPEQLKDGLSDVMFRLMDWELHDRCKIALKTIDLGFKFTTNQSKVVWCTLALEEMHSFVIPVLDDLKARFGLWQTDRIKGEWTDLRVLSAAAPVDLATFVLTLWSLEFPDQLDERRWVQAVRKEFRMEDKELWSVTSVVRFMFAFFSGLGYQAMAGYYLTMAQRQLFLRRKEYRLDTFIHPMDFVDDLIIIL